MTAQLTQDTRIAELHDAARRERTRSRAVRWHRRSRGTVRIPHRGAQHEGTRATSDFDGAIGRNCSLTLKSYGGERIFNGVLIEAQWLGLKGVYYAYRLVLRPWLWQCTRTTHARIFSDKRAPEIIKEVFNKRGFNDFRDALTDNYPKLEYCVQYRETDFAFVSRLMEQHGIYYFFEHSKDKHVLVLSDSKSSHKPVPGREKTPFIALGGDDRRDREHIYHWATERRFRTGKVELNDYDFKQPGKKLLVNAKASERYTKSRHRILRRPGQIHRAQRWRESTPR